ncbi:helix-turn-helix transcriptional regulator [Streptomyces sp. NPDC017941]|uniref:helix-turn-helix transcriptional regulator n=1 Tax=unclassified Streptomyces TaxID=2593676 RepID=UPI003790A558
MNDAYGRVDALLDREPDLPEPRVRAALRRADRLTQQDVADALGVHRIQVSRWETERADPRNPHRRAYARLLRGLADKHPTVAKVS